MKPSYAAKLMISLHPCCSDFFQYIYFLNAANFPVGSTSPCNSDDERKPRFIEKGTVFVRFPRHSKHFRGDRSRLISLSEPYFQWRWKADAFPRRLPMTSVLYHRDVFPLTCSLFLSEWRRSNHVVPQSSLSLCILCQWKKEVHSRKLIVFFH